MAKIELADMIKQLRDELQTAVRAGEGEEIRFELGEVTLEAQVEVAKEGSGKAGVKFWVVDAETSGKASKAVTQKLVLKLRPVGEDDETIRLLRLDRR